MYIYFLLLYFYYDINYYFNFIFLLLLLQNESQKDKVLTSQADYYYSQQRYNLSAEYFAQIHSISFEEIVLRFINKNENDALRIYLLKKLEKLKKQVNCY